MTCDCPLDYVEHGAHGRDMPGGFGFEIYSDGDYRTGSRAYEVDE